MKRKLQVFISSTYTDLVAERQAAVSAVLKAGHIPAGMELFTAGDKSQMKTIERWIDESDVYMLILGGRYGSIEPTSGLSYTELEYDYAKENGKPSFSVVITEKALEAKIKSAGLNSIERDNSSALKQFREKALSNISSFFDDDKDIKLCVHESMSDFTANPELKGWIAVEDIEDTKTLHDEIDRLREENLNLTGEIKKLNDNLGKQNINNEVEKIEKDKETIEFLKEVPVTVPAEISGDNTEFVSDLFYLTYKYRDKLINGINNNAGMAEIDRFFYFNILPKLQAHGLAENEKVAGVRYRRSFLNKEGQRLLASYEKDRVLSKKSKKLATLESTK